MATLAMSGAAIISAGAGVGAVPDDSWDHWIEQGEGYLSGLTKHNLVSSWPTMSGAATSPMLTEYCERQAAIEGIKYDITGYDSVAEYEDMINVHLYKMEQIRKLLENADVQDFMAV